MMLWYDIAFCEAEVMHATLNNGQFEVDIITDDPKIMPIRIFAVEFFAMSKKDFGFREKQKHLEKQAIEKQNQERPDS